MSPATPNLALPYPVLADTADVPRDIKALADKLDALLGGGGGGGSGGTAVGANIAVLEPGVAGQVRAGRELTVADFTSLGLSTPVGLFNLSGLTNLGSAGPLVNLGAVPFGVGINGAASTCAVFSGSTGQALYIADTGAADPFRIRTGSWGCWVRTAKRGTGQHLLSKLAATPGQRVFGLSIVAANVVHIDVYSDGTASVGCDGISDVADDRWHFVIATHDGTQVRAYVDGVLEAVAVAGFPLFAGSSPLSVGAYGADASTAAGAPHYGRVDEAFVTADVLTEDQIRSLYAARLTHTLGAIPSNATVRVHRRRRGAPLAVADFTTQPLRLHNFTAGALTDQGSGAVALTNNGGAISVAGADGSPGGAFSFAGAQSLSSTDAGLPGGLTARSYGCWFKTTSTAGPCFIGWGTIGTADARLATASSTGTLAVASGADIMSGPFIADGYWHQAIVVEDNAAGDGVRRKLYLDGRLVGGSTVLNAITLQGANRFRIGADPNGGSNLTGQIDGAFVTGYPLARDEIARLYARGAQDLGASPKNAGDHVERLDATSVLFIGDTLESQYTVDVGVQT